MAGFAEEGLIGCTLRIGAEAVVAVTDRDRRCKMITLDPETGRASPEVLRQVAQTHGGNAGLYAVVLVEGTVRTGDSILILDGRLDSAPALPPGIVRSNPPDAMI